jgi:Calcineurin-like phosphoesterase/TIR domain
MAMDEVEGARPQRLVWLYASRDERLARELERLFSVLERQGLVENWSPRLIAAGQELEPTIRQHIARADILLLLLSADFFASESEVAWMESALEQRRLRGARVIPVLLRPSVLPPDLEALTPLPRNRIPISTWKDRDEALLEVVEGVRTILAYRPGSEGAAALALASLRMQARGEVTPPAQRAARGGGEPRPAAEESTARAPAPAPPAGSAASAAPALPPIASIFRLNASPDITFVEPSQFPTLQAELEVMGSGLIVEGPSKVGKSTAIKKALAKQSPRRPERWIQGMLPEEDRDLDELLDALVRGDLSGHLIIDDFHYLPDAIKKKLAIRMKMLADQDEPRAKMTIIGVNPVGSSLTQAIPDLAGRFRIVKMDRQRDLKIAELVIQGEQAANIRYRRRDEIINEADGSFYIAQLLCYEAAVKSGILRAQEATRDIELGPSDVLEAIQEELRARYNGDLRDFAAHDERPPPRGACLALLWLLSRSKSGDISVQEAIYQFPDLSPAFDWLRASNLQRCFDEHPELKRLLYYNRSAATLSIEDPQLKFYLRKLDWADLARGSGHVSVQFHPIDGPSFAPPTPRVGFQIGGATPSGGASPKGTSRPGDDAGIALLHLSDLHFGNEDQAALWYAQLAADLRQQGCERLGVLVVSGDIANLSIPEEYTAARLFLERLMGGFSLSPQQVILTPGNHDLSWSLAQDAYVLHRRARYKGALEEGTFIAHSPEVVEVRDEALYKKRFQHFAEVYRQVRGEEYPLEYEQQGIIHHLPEQRLVILALNSAWEIDHHFRSRASIHTGALSRALVWLGEHRYPDHLHLAVWHHPVTGPAPDRIVDTGFMQQLAVAGFRVALHGHVHRADSQLYRHDVTAPGGRRIEIVAAGTFGAPVHQWVPGYPLQYNLIRITRRELVVETRCREELNGAWRPDARWQQGPGRDPLPRYRIELDG